LQKASKRPDNSVSSPEKQAIEPLSNAEAAEAAGDGQLLVSSAGKGFKIDDATTANTAACVDVVHIAAKSPSIAPAPCQPESNQFVIAAAIAAKLHEEYMRPSSYTSNVLFNTGSRLSVQSTIKTLLRGSSSSVSLSSRAGPSPFLDRVARIPHPPSAQKSGTEAAFAKRRLLLTSTQVASTPPADSDEIRAAGTGSRSGHQGGMASKLFPPLPRKRS
jgi:hypothetical protein